MEMRSTISLLFLLAALNCVQGKKYNNFGKFIIMHQETNSYVLQQATTPAKATVASPLATAPAKNHVKMMKTAVTTTLVNKHLSGHLVTHSFLASIQVVLLQNYYIFSFSCPSRDYCRKTTVQPTGTASILKSIHHVMHIRQIVVLHIVILLYFSSSLRVKHSITYNLK